jgi:hypothetical protein
MTCHEVKRKGNHADEIYISSNERQSRGTKWLLRAC